jgi:hypothetical protein
MADGSNPNWFRLVTGTGNNGSCLDRREAAGPRKIGGRSDRFALCREGCCELGCDDPLDDTNGDPLDTNGAIKIERD